MDRPDRDLVDTGAGDGQERIRLVDVTERGWWSGVAAHRVPAVGPVLVQDEAARQRMVGRLDAEQVAHLAFEAACRERDGGEAGDPGCGSVGGQDEFDAPVGVRRDEQVNDAEVVQVVVGGDQGEPVALLE